MTKTKVDHEQEYVIAVLAPRFKVDYNTVMKNIIHSLGAVENIADRNCNHFVFLHDGVTSGTTGYVIETVNKISPSARLFKDPRSISARKLPLDIEMYGKRSHWHWLDELIKLKPDLIVVFDPGDLPVVQYAQRLGKEHGIQVDVYKAKKES